MEPPNKRRRISQIDTPDEELHQRRARNDLRLKSAFESIFDKYGKDFTGIGDEVDIDTGEIVVNHGHLSMMRHEKDPGRVEYLYDELEGEQWSGEDKRTIGRGIIARQINLRPAFQSPLCPSNPKGREDPWQSADADESDSLMGDLVINDADAELQRGNINYEHYEPNLKPSPKAQGCSKIPVLQQNQSHSALRARSPPHYPGNVTHYERDIEPAWRAPPLPTMMKTYQEELRRQTCLIPDTYEDRPMSPPGQSLWALESSKGKQTHGRRSMPSLSYEWSKVSVNQCSERSPTICAAGTLRAPPRIHKTIGRLPWTEAENNILRCLKPETKNSYSQLTAYFPGRSEIEIEERWSTLCDVENNSFHRSARCQEKKPSALPKASPVAGVGQSWSKIRSQLLGKSISLNASEKLPLQLSGTTEEQIHPVMSPDIERVCSAAQTGQFQANHIPTSGTTMEKNVEPKVAARKGATINSGLGNTTLEGLNHRSHESKDATKHPAGVLKRVTKRLAKTRKAKKLPLTATEGAFVSDEIVCLSQKALSEASNQAFLDLSSQQKLPRRGLRIRKLAARARRPKPLATNRVATKSFAQKPSDPEKSIPLLLASSTNVLSPSPVMETSSRSSTKLELHSTNSDSDRKEHKNSPRWSLRSTSSEKSSFPAKFQSLDRMSPGGRRDPLTHGDQGLKKPCTSCSAKTKTNDKGLLKSNSLCDNCLSQLSPHPCSLERPAFLNESGCREHTHQNDNHIPINSREDFNDPLDIMVQPTTISQTRPQESPPSRSRTQKKPKAIIKHKLKALDDLSDDELSMPVQRLLRFNLTKLTSSSHTNPSRRRSALV